MTALLEKAVATVRTFSAEKQDEFARILLHLVEADEEVHELTPEERADLQEADAEIARGEIATEEDVRLLWAKHGL